MKMVLLLPTVLATLWFSWNLRAFDSSDNALQRVTVYPGANDTAISNLLYGRGLIHSDLAYRLYARLSGKRGKLKAGVYELSPSMSTPHILGKLTTGDVATYLFTILPAQRLSQIRDSFIAAGFSHEDVDLALDANNYREHPALTDLPFGASLEGYLHPESFQYTLATPLSVIVESSLDVTASLLTPEVKKALRKQGLSPHQGVTLASIVEREVNDPQDKPVVAQVFLSRLAQGMPLGSDVTAHYGASLRGVRETVAVDSLYNTRRYRGLPPGPISNIRSEALQAVANPADTDYLYFVAGDDGTTYFSRTLEEHTALVQEHCKVLCQLE